VRAIQRIIIVPSILS
jgi:HEAT repeats